MKQLAILSCLFLFMSLTTLIKDDKKTIKQITSLVSKQEFDKALALFSKISEEGKNGKEFLAQASVTYDSLKMYQEAINAYEYLVKMNAEETGLVTRVTYLQNELAKANEIERQRMEKMKNCTKCAGTGFLQSKVVCPDCSGTLQVRKMCQRCQGQALVNCSTCGGKGQKSMVVEGRGVEVPCERCNHAGTLPCSAYCNKGTVMVDCKKCSSIGTVIQTTKCDLH